MEEYVCIRTIEGSHDELLAEEGDELYLKDDAFFNLKTDTFCCQVGSEYGNERVEKLVGFRIINEELSAIIICDKCNGKGETCLWCEGSGRLNKFLVTKLTPFQTK